MDLFHFEWFKCADGYSFEEAPADQPGAAVFIVPTSDKWIETQPLKVPAVYRIFAACDATEADMLRFTNAYGFLERPKADREFIGFAYSHLACVQALVEAIDESDWPYIVEVLKKRGQHSKFPTGGIGNLGVVFDAPKKNETRPRFRLRPASLADALQVQALFDAAYDIQHKECANPHCSEWFPVSGPNAHRVDAQYHSQACRRRHVYFERKEGAH